MPDANLPSEFLPSGALWDNIPCALLLEKDGVIVAINQHCVDLLGYSLTASPAPTPRTFFRSDQEFADFDAAQAEPTALRHADGSVRWCLIRCRPIDRQDAAAGTLWVFTDVSAQVAAQQQLQQAHDTLAQALANQQALIAKVQVGLLIAKNRLVAWGNQCFFDMVGYTRDELIGQSVATYFADPGDFARIGTEGYPLLAAGRSYATELSVKCRDGSVLQCVITGNAIDPENMDEGFIWSFADISALIKAEAHAKEARERERQAVEREHLEIEKMAALGVVVAGVAHEINTPIGVGYTLVTHYKRKTREFVELFGSGAMKRSDLQNYVDMSTEMSEQLATNISRAAELIQSFKQIAVDQSSDDQRRFNLKSYLQEIVTSLMPTLRKTPHKVEVDCPDNIEMNSFPGALAQVITNFVMNALIHAFESESGGIMTISAQRKDNQLLLDFSDNGKGIAAEHLPKIFDPFFTTRRGTGGSGLGLNIVFNLVARKLQGRVSCSSNPGSGTVFHMVMPLTLEPAMTSA